MLTTQQLTERKRYIGASEAAAVCDLDPYRTSWDVWASKTSRVDDFAGNDATRAGDRLESVIIDWAADKLKASSVERSIFVVHPQLAFIAANLDAVLGISGARCNVDAKTSGITSPLRFDYWTDDEFPEKYAIQLQHQMACDPTLDHAYLAALCPPKGFLVYRVERDQPVIDAIMERCIDFWERHVIPDIPPESSPSLDVAKRLRRVPKKETMIDGGLVRLWSDASEAAKVAAKAEEQAKAAVIAALGDAEAGIFDGGSVTFFEQSRAGYTVEPATFRVLRKKKG